jgi:hypothetical protein
MMGKRHTFQRNLSSAVELVFKLDMYLVGHWSRGKSLFPGLGWKQTEDQVTNLCSTRHFSSRRLLCGAPATAVIPLPSKQAKKRCDWPTTMFESPKGTLCIRFPALLRVRSKISSTLIAIRIQTRLSR